jgi:cyclophilin family peptidyl-prolyl cis-trans isomerase
MKKYLLIIFVCALALSGCSSSRPVDVTSDNGGSQGATASDNKVKNNQMSIATTTIDYNQPDKSLLSEYGGVILHTNLGDIKLEFYNDEAPITVTNFIRLAQTGFYDGTKFHRVIPDFMIQGGDPNSKDDDWSNDGMGGPGYQFNDEPNKEKLLYGSMAMANSGPNTNGSQFFIVTKTDGTSWLDGSYNNFGHVVKGMDVALKIVNLPRNAKDHPTTDAIIKSVTLVKK